MVTENYVFYMIVFLKGDVQKFSYKNIRTIKKFVMSIGFKNSDQAPILIQK